MRYTIYAKHPLYNKVLYYYGTCCIAKYDKRQVLEIKVFRETVLSIVHICTYTT